jgi:hypothetical protein
MHSPCPPLLPRPCHRRLHPGRSSPSPAAIRSLAPYRHPQPHTNAYHPVRQHANSSVHTHTFTKPGIQYTWQRAIGFGPFSSFNSKCLPFHTTTIILVIRVTGDGARGACGRRHQPAANMSLAPTCAVHQTSKKGSLVCSHMSQFPASFRRENTNSWT